MYVGSQSENTPVGTSIVSVLARDIDQTGSPNARVEYSLLSGDVDFFEIDPATGVVSNQVVLVSYCICCYSRALNFASINYAHRSILQDDS